MACGSPTTTVLYSRSSIVTDLQEEESQVSKQEDLFEGTFGRLRMQGPNGFLE